MKKRGGSESSILVGPSKSVLVYVLHSLEYVLGLARFRVFVQNIYIYITTSQSCRSCGDTDDDETTEHLLCSCPALASLRVKTVENYYYFFNSPIKLSNTSIKVLMCFINGS